MLCVEVLSIENDFCRFYLPSQPYQVLTSGLTATEAGLLRPAALRFSSTLTSARRGTRLEPLAKREADTATSTGERLWLTAGLGGGVQMRRSVMLTSVAVVLVLGASGIAAARNANGNHATYTWVVGATTPSDTAIARDGSTITMKGSGTMTAGPGHTASGGGSYSLSSGGSGGWSVTGVQGFVSYGPAGPGFPPGFTGGEAKLKVALDNGARGVLTVICVLGSPPAGKKEGITVILGSGGQFTKQDGGNTVFIAS